MVSKYQQKTWNGRAPVGEFFLIFCPRLGLMNRPLSWDVWNFCFEIFEFWPCYWWITFLLEMSSTDQATWGNHGKSSSQTAGTWWRPRSLQLILLLAKCSVRSALNNVRSTNPFNIGLTLSQRTDEIQAHTPFSFPGWWLNQPTQPTWKILIKIGSFPQAWVKIKHIWNNHQLDFLWNAMFFSRREWFFSLYIINLFNPRFPDQGR